MAVAGIICEYNPFHLGHARQLKLLREAMGEESLVVGVMSGNYVQRGMPAAWDKYARAAAAVAAGVDLVLELPLTGVLSSAEGFARAGVEVLHRLGAVDTLCFGAECGEAAAFQALAELVEGEDYRQALRQGLDAGLSYAAAREKAAGSLSALLRKPNAILGVEYCRALRTLGASIKPLVIRRGGDYHALARLMQGGALRHRPAGDAPRGRLEGLCPSARGGDSRHSGTIRRLLRPARPSRPSTGS